MWPVSSIKKVFAEVCRRKMHVLFTAARSGDLAAVTKAVNRNPKALQWRYYEGESLLHAAVEAGHTGVVSFLAGKGAALEEKDKNGCTALLRALMGGHADMAHVLLDAGADVLVRAHREELMELSALGQAAYKCDLDMVKKIVGLGADVNDKGVPCGKVHFNAPLWGACLKGKNDIVEYLLEQGADVDGKTYHVGNTPLMVAIGYDHVKTVALLLAHHADVRMTTIQTKNPAISALISEALTQRAKKAFHDGVDMTGQWLRPARIVKKKGGP